MDRAFDRLALLNGKDRSDKHPLIHPRDAASLLVIDRRETPYKLLMGLRHQKSSFMPDVYVFPGGALDLADLELAKSYLPDLTKRSLNSSILSGRDSLTLETYEQAELFTPHSHQEITRLAGIAENLLPDHEPSLSFKATQREIGAGLILCALRELYEETGLHLYSDFKVVQQEQSQLSHPFGPDELPFSHLNPLFEGIVYLSRAITPPGIKKRFDTRFFLHDYRGPQGWTGRGDNELVKTAWVSFEEALSLKIHPMTRVVLEDLNEHLSSLTAFEQPHQVAFYQYLGKRFEIGAIEMETPS